MTTASSCSACAKPRSPSPTSTATARWAIRKRSPWQIVEQIKKTLGLPDLKVREVAVTSSNRIPMLLNNQIDLECGSTTHTHERENQVAFSDSFFQYAVRMIVRRS